MASFVANDRRDRVDTAQDTITNKLLANMIDSEVDNIVIKGNVTIEGDLEVEQETFGITADNLSTTGVPVVVSTSVPPVAGDILVATSPTTASWQSATSETTATGTATFGVDPVIWATFIPNPPFDPIIIPQPRSGTFWLSKKGSQVFLRLENIGFTSVQFGNPIVSEPFIPANFLPGIETWFFAPVYDSGDQAGGMARITLDGVLTFYADFQESDFNQASDGGLYGDIFLTWSTL